MTDAEKTPPAPMLPAAPAPKGTAVAPPPAAPAPRPEGWVPPQERKGWRCRACAGFSGKTYKLPSNPDETCVECNETVDPVEAQTVVMDRVGRELAKSGLAAGQQPSTVPRPQSAPAKLLPWCDVEEAGALLGCGRTTVFKLIKQGRLREAEKAPGRGTHVTRASVLAYQEQVATEPVKKKGHGSRRSTPDASAALPDRETLATDLAAQRKKLFK